MSCTNTCENKGSNSYIFLIVLYILLIIVLGNTISPC